MVIVRMWEGLGNQMFQYAYARALHEKGIEVGLDSGKSYADAFVRRRNHAMRKVGIQNFRISLPFVDMRQYGKYEYLKQDTVLRRMVHWLGSHSLWKYRVCAERELDHFQYSPQKAKLKGNCYVNGWFQNEKYFQDIRCILLREFVPRERIKLSKGLREALEDPESVSVHIRRGDYVKLGRSLNSVYYKRAISKMRQLYQNPIFLVFSDDLEWARQNVPIEGRVVYVNEEGRLQDYEELFLMSKCRSNIVANSTFSWWAAWLNQNEGKIVIAPKEWGMRMAKRQWILL